MMHTYIRNYLRIKDQGQRTTENGFSNVPYASHTIQTTTQLTQWLEHQPHHTAIQTDIGLSSTVHQPPTTPCSLALSQKLAGSEVLEEISGVCK